MKGNERGRPFIPLCRAIHFFYLPHQLRNAPTPQTVTNSRRHVVSMLQHLQPFLSFAQDSYDAKGWREEENSVTRSERPSPRNSLSPWLLVSEKSIMDARPMLSRFVVADWTIIPYVSSSYLQGKLTKLCCSCLLSTKGIRSRNLARWCSRVRMPYAFWSSQPRSRWSKSVHTRCRSLKAAQPTKNKGRKENCVKTPS